MDTIVEKRYDPAELERFLRHVGKPAQWSSPRLTGVADEIAAHIRRQPDITLGEIGTALVGAGFTWSPEGKLVYAPRHVALLEELEGLIEIHGSGTRAAELFL